MKRVSSAFNQNGCIYRYRLVLEFKLEMKCLENIAISDVGKKLISDIPSNSLKKKTNDNILYKINLPCHACPQPVYFLLFMLRSSPEYGLKYTRLGLACF